MGIVNDLIGKIFGFNVPVGTDQGRNEVLHTASPGTDSHPSKPLTNETTPVDIDQVLTSLATTHKEKLDWKHSIVDLLKLVGMDSSLHSRKALASELGYTGDSNDSATMNIWLQKQIMKKLAENGGKVPAELLAA